jgi:hypothetical protein
MSYGTFLYNLFLEPELAFKSLKENFDIKYVILTLLIVLTGWFNVTIFTKSSAGFNLILFLTGSNLFNTIIKNLFVAIIIHSFAALLNYSGNIKKFFAMLFLCQAPYILLSSFSLLTLLFDNLNINTLIFIVNIWSLYLVFICIKVNYSIGIFKSALLYISSFIILFSTIFIYFIINTISLILRFV